MFWLKIYTLMNIGSSSMGRILEMSLYEKVTLGAKYNWSFEGESIKCITRWTYLLQEDIEFPHLKKSFNYDVEDVNNSFRFIHFFLFIVSKLGASKSISPKISRSCSKTSWCTLHVFLRTPFLIMELISFFS